MDQLRLCRTAAHVLNTLLRDQYQLAQRAYVFQGDNPDHWLVLDDWQVIALVDGYHAAHCWVERGEMGVRINDIYSVIREPVEFDPWLYGIEVDYREDPFDPDRYPDIMDMVTIPDIPNIDQPRMRIASQVSGRSPRVIASR